MSRNNPKILDFNRAIDAGLTDADLISTSHLPTVMHAVDLSHLSSGKGSLACLIGTRRLDQKLTEMKLTEMFIYPALCQRCYVKLMIRS